MNKLLAMMICAGAAFPSGARAAELVLDALVARITIVPEVRADFAVEVQAGSERLPPVTVTQEGGRASLTNGVEVGACVGSGDHMRVGLRGGSQVEMSEAPEITIRAPRAFSVSGTESGLVGRIGPADDLRMTQSGCSRWDVAAVTDALHADFSAGARLAAEAGDTMVLRASAGAVIAAGAAHDLMAEASAGAEIHIESVSGSAEATVASGGRIEIEGGETAILRADASTGGQISHGGSVGALHATATIGAQIVVSEAESVASRSVSIGGQISVGD
jgi:hypothetical protein